ncbi:MAG: hypothetical protein ACYDDO_09980 [Acidiferrobacterales bacterium]
MIALSTGPQYERNRTKFREELERHQRRIAKTVDLFSRIKSTEQAEEVITVLFAIRQLKKSLPNVEVTEQQVLDDILEWKTSWCTEEKTLAVARAIRNLVLLGWVRLHLSDTLTEAA